MARDSRLKKNQQLKLEDGHTITVTEKLGEGGQGIVYKVRIDETHEEKALKWYFIEKIEDPAAFHANLRTNIQIGTPSPSFIWPEKLTEWMNDTFGYIMRIWPSEYKQFSKFLMGRACFASCKAMVNAALNIAAPFKYLHAKGYNYQDLNDGNFAINPQTGDVLICDNDNVVGHGQSLGIRGKVRYTAPEVVRNEKPPARETDKFSLAVILFMLLIGDHPLEGKRTNLHCLVNSKDREFFGIKPLFIFDETDQGNRPVPGLHKNAISLWPYFPKFMQTAFMQSFSQESLLQSSKRLNEEQWVELLTLLKSSIVKCPHCMEHIFLNCNGETTCPSCQKHSSSIGYLKFPKRLNMDISVPIFESVCLVDRQIDENSENYQTDAASVLVKPGKFGLKNISQRTWVVSTPKGRRSVKKQGDVVTLSLGVKIDFGNGNIAEVMPSE